MIFQFGDPFALFAGLYLIMIVLVVVFYIIAILIAIWVYKDAKKRDMNAAVWLLIVLVTGCIGCIIYLVIRNKE
ncbi:MAG: hypothetical protein ACW98D_14085 [Promethearchaeota archaeon]|jgi:RsiW-degrading membrane proteinase PrsW (M82 family)